MSRYLNSSNALAPFGIGVWDEEKSNLWRGPNNWSYHQRNPNQGYLRRKPFFELWGKSGFADFSQCPMLGAEPNVTGDYFEPPSYGGGGKQGWYFINGQVIDQTGAAQAGVTVKAYRVSDDLYVGSSVSDYLGNYSVETPYIGVAHFIRAYISGSPDEMGTTISTLIPTAT